MATMEVTAKEAAKLENKTERTINRWISAGCSLDEESILYWSEKKDLRSRGRTRKLWIAREERDYFASK
jgi:hypothetical protein